MFNTWFTRNSVSLSFGGKGKGLKNKRGLQRGLRGVMNPKVAFSI